MVDFLDFFVFGFEEIGVGLLEAFYCFFEFFFRLCDNSLLLEDDFSNFKAGSGEEFVNFLGFIRGARVAAGG